MLGIARATVIGNDNGGRPLPPDPGPSHLLLREKASKCAGPPCGTPRGRGVLVSLCPCRRPRRPRHRPRQQSCHGLCFKPRRSRAFHAATAPRQALAQAGCRVTPMQDRGSTVSRFARLLRVFDRLPTGSFSSSHGQGRDSSNRVAFLTRRLVTP
jgi:hypothetical protein